MHNNLYRISSQQGYVLIGLVYGAFSWIFCKFSHAAPLSHLLHFSYDLHLNFLVILRSLNLFSVFRRPPAPVCSFPNYSLSCFMALRAIYMLTLKFISLSYTSLNSGLKYLIASQITISITKSISNLMCLKLQF